MASLDHEMNDMRSLRIDFPKPDQNGDALSPEDVAWADYCLIKDLDASDIGWDSLKRAFSEIIDLQSYIDLSSVAENGADMKTTQAEIPCSIGDSEDLQGALNGIGHMYEDMESSNTLTNNDANLSAENLELPMHPESHLGNAFRPDFKDEIPAIEPIDPDFDPDFSVVDLEVPFDGIFRVWDLDTPNEEDELTVQLKKAIAGSASSTSHPVHDVLPKWNNLADMTVDDLTAGLAHLSLSQL